MSPRLGLALVAIAGAAVAAAGWPTWPHPFVDFGRELYTAWRISEGDLLYRDIAYFNGPLSPHWNALLFTLFGVGVRTLLVANLLVAAGVAALLFQLTRRATGVGGATAGTLFFALAIAFTQMEPVGNDSFAAPYSHEITHGLLLSLLSLQGLLLLRRRPGPGAALAGLALGAVALTKSELLVALGAAALLLALARVLRGEPVRADALRVGLWSLLPPALAGVALVALLGPAEGLRGLLGSWPGTLDGELLGHHFYRWTRGTLGAGENLLLLGAWGAGWALWAALAHGLARGLASSGAAVATACGVAAFAGLALLPLEWTDCTRPLPVLLAGVVGLELLRARRGVASVASEGWEARLLLAGFSLFLLAKVILKARLIQYGFALAAPGAVLAVALAWEWLPRASEARGGSATLSRAVLAAAVAAAAVSLLHTSLLYFGTRDHPLGTGRDAFRADLRAPVVRRALEDLESRLGPADRLAVLPEGVMLNYLLRRETPTRYINFMPPELILFGEAETLSALRASPPSVVALVHKRTDVYGVPLFGRDYGRALMQWVRQHYRLAARYGDAPLREGSFFGIDVLVPREGEGVGARGGE